MSLVVQYFLLGGALVWAGYTVFRLIKPKKGGSCNSCGTCASNEMKRAN